jgi:hypothetical protein
MIGMRVRTIGRTAMSWHIWKPSVKSFLVRSRSAYTSATILRTNTQTANKQTLGGRELQRRVIAAAFCFVKHHTQAGAARRHSGHSVRCMRRSAHPRPRRHVPVEPLGAYIGVLPARLRPVGPARKSAAKGAHLKHSLLAEPLWSAERGFAAVAPEQSPPHSPAPLEGGGGALEGYSRGTLLSGYVRRSALVDVWLKAQCAADGLERSAVERAALGWEPIGTAEGRKGNRSERAVRIGDRREHARHAHLPHRPAAVYHLHGIHRGVQRTTGRAA